MPDLILPDRKLETMEGYYPGRKPIGNVKIDWSHPLTRGLICYALPTPAGSIDLVANLLLDDRATGGVSSEGLIRQSTSTNNIIKTIQPVNGSLTSICRVTLTANNSGHQFIFGDISNNKGFEVVVDFANVIWYATEFNFSVNLTSASLSPSEPATVAFIYDKGKGATIYKNKSAVGGDSISGALSSVSPQTFFVRDDLWEAYFYGNMSYGIVFDRAISVAEYNSLYDNPYQFLIPA